MKKRTKIIIGISIAVVIAIIVAILIIINNINKEDNTLKSNLNIKTINDLENILINMYAGLEDQLPESLRTTAINISDTKTLTDITGLINAEGLEYGIISKPTKNEQEYTTMLIKTLNIDTANLISKKISESIDMQKWKEEGKTKAIYITNSEDVVCVVIGSPQTVLQVYENFRTISGKIEKQYRKNIK